jgi:hypothetical protein
MADDFHGWVCESFKLPKPFSRVTNNMVWESTVEKQACEKNAVNFHFNGLVAFKPALRASAA